MVDRLLPELEKELNGDRIPPLYGGGELSRQLKPLGERLDGRGLIARRRKGLVKDEGRVGISDDLCHWKPRSGI